MIQADESPHMAGWRRESTIAGSAAGEFPDRCFVPKRGWPIPPPADRPLTPVRYHASSPRQVAEPHC